MVLVGGALLLASSARTRPTLRGPTMKKAFPTAQTRPIPASVFEETYEFRRKHYSVIQPEREVARVLWTAQDRDLSKHADRWPQEVLREAVARERATVVPALEALVARPGTNLEAMEALARFTKLGIGEAQPILNRALDSELPEERSIAAILLAKEGSGNKIRPALVVRRLREMINDDRDPSHLLAAAQALAKVDPAHALPYARRAHVRATKPQPRTPEERRLWQRFVLVRGSLRDRSVLPALRGYAVQRSDPHLAARAVDALALGFGSSERKALEAALGGLATARLQAANWLGFYGDRRSVYALERAAKSPPPDLDNGGGFRYVNDTLREVAALLKQGERGERPKLIPIRIETGHWPGRR